MSETPNVLIAYPYLGELGWEAFNWAPHVRWRAGTAPFSRVIVHTRSGNEALYHDFATEFRVVSGFETCSEGNAFVVRREDAYRHYRECCRDTARYAAGLSNCHVSVVQLLAGPDYRYFRYKERNKTFARLRASPATLSKWRPRVHARSLVFHLRAISKSRKKNTPPDMYAAAARWAERNGMQFITVGHTFGEPLKFPVLGTNLLNCTSMDDLAALMSLSTLVVGSSSGPMHIAALTGAPHVVWGGERGDVRDRYLKTWNPFATPVTYVGTRWRYPLDKLIAGLDSALRATDVHSRRC